MSELSTHSQGIADALLRLEVAVGDIEQVARYVKRPVFVAALREGLSDGWQRSQKPFLTPQEVAVETGDSEQQIARFAAAGIIGCYGGPGNPLYAREEIYSAIRERRWHTDGAKMRQRLAA